VPGQGDVVVLEEDDAGLLPGQADDARDDVFAGLVGRVGLAGEQDLHRPLRVAEQLVQARPVSKQEVRPLVRSESTAEADRERVQI